MTDRLQAKLIEAKAEVQRFKERISLRVPTVHKDVSLVALIPKWSGQESAVTLQEFFQALRAQRA
jgi:hypothetical protein